MTKKTVVLHPALAVSHFVPMVQLADALLDAGYAVAVAFIDPAVKQDIALSSVVRRVAASKPRVAFHTLPRVDPPAVTAKDAHFMIQYRDLVLSYDRRLHEFLLSMTPGTVHAVILDAASSPGAVDVVKSLGVPAYMFYPMNASALSVFIQIPSMVQEIKEILRSGRDGSLEFRGVPAMPVSHLPSEIIDDPEGEVHEMMVHGLRKVAEAGRVLVNSFASLEPRAVDALADLPQAPPVYCVGPLLASAEEEKERHPCLDWLDAQSERSVVYLCFGSMGVGSHSKAQMKEIAVGLERSGHRFLWVVRAPPSLDPCADPDLDDLLPPGFLQRTTGRGLVVKLWAPQVDVLRHAATGAFVTHCGWNSVLEAISAGVPMLCWPLHSEQRMNKVVLVEEMGVGVEVLGWQRGLVVAAEEVEAKVRLVMESDEGERIRARVTKYSQAAAKAWEDDGGSSRAAFRRFLADADDDRASKTTCEMDPCVKHSFLRPVSS